MGEAYEHSELLLYKALVLEEGEQLQPYCLVVSLHQDAPGA